MPKCESADSVRDNKISIIQDVCGCALWCAEMHRRGLQIVEIVLRRDDDSFRHRVGLHERSRNGSVAQRREILQDGIVHNAKILQNLV